MQLVTDILNAFATLRPETPEGQRLLKELGDHFKGIGTALERYRKASEPQTRTISVSAGTEISRYNRS
jgi:hypothetical protein